MPPQAPAKWLGKQQNKQEPEKRPRISRTNLKFPKVHFLYLLMILLFSLLFHISLITSTKVPGADRQMAQRPGQRE